MSVMCEFKVPKLNASCAFNIKFVGTVMYIDPLSQSNEVFYYGN